MSYRGKIFYREENKNHAEPVGIEGKPVNAPKLQETRFLKRNLKNNLRNTGVAASKARMQNLMILFQEKLNSKNRSE